MNSPFKETDINGPPTGVGQACEQAVLRLQDSDRDSLQQLLARWGLQLVIVAEDNSIPGSFWGEEEAGLIDDRLFARPDTPIHSLLHEAGHYVCMDAQRRSGLDTNAGGDYDEENAVCYLQVLASSHIRNYGRHRMFADMDAWGYSFRLGSTRRWFEEDAEDARAWLIAQQITDEAQNITWNLRD